MKPTHLLALPLFLVGCGGSIDDYDDEIIDDTQGEAVISKPGTVTVYEIGNLGIAYTELNRFSSCTTTAVSGCTVEVCTVAPPVTKQPHAGAITIQSDKLSGVVRPDKTTGAYPTLTSLGTYGAFSPGALVRVTANGSAKIGAFELKARGPYAIDYTGPGYGTLNNTYRNKNLPITWAAPSPSPVRVEIESPHPGFTPNASKYRFLRCTQLDGTKLVVPAAALSKMPAGQAAFRINTEKIKRVTVGDRRITLSVRKYAYGDTMTLK